MRAIQRRFTTLLIANLFAVAIAVSPLAGQQASTATQNTATVPTLVHYGGTVADADGQPLSGTIGITFLLYKDSQGGAPLWMETQNVHLDAHGNYSVMLGETSNQGLPTGLFASGEARWLGVQPQGLGEQPRVLLLSVPYALKAGDAETIGGLPPSAFMLAPVPGAASAVENSAAPATSPAATPALGGTGTTNFLPLWTNSTTLGSSALFQSGTGATAKVGINTSTPAATLDIKGTETLRGNLSFPATGVATATAGKNSPAVNFTASVFNGTTSTAVAENFRLQAEPVGNNTSSAGGSLNLLFAQGSATFTETGLKFGSNGQITFAPGQVFPGTGTITGITTGSGLTGGGTAGSVTLNIDSSSVPLLSANNTFNGDQNINGSLNLIGALSAPAIYGSSGYFRYPNDNSVVVSINNGQGFGIQVLAPQQAISTVSTYYRAVDAYSHGANAIYGTTTHFLPAIQGESDYASGGGIGVYGVSDQGGQGVWGESVGNFFFNNAGPDGVHGVAHGASGSGVAGVNTASGGIGVYGAVYDSNSYAGHFDGNVVVNGSLSKSGGSFKIDHPLDPANKYLYHSFVESPDMKNIYDGVAVLDAHGEAVVEMPDWFGPLNRDFRYQLTCIGGFAPVYIAEEVANNRFTIAGGKPGMKVSWQVTGTRQDEWANAHRIPVEEAKSADERGTYLHPELFGASKEAGLSWKRFHYPDIADATKIRSPINKKNGQGPATASSVKSEDQR